MSEQKKKGHFLKNIFTGLSVNVPILGTFYLVHAAVTSVDVALLGTVLESADTVNGVSGGLPEFMNPGFYIPFLYKFPGTGLIVLTLYLYFSGVVFNTWLGKKFHSVIDNIMGRFPVLGTAYDFLKKLMDQVNSKKDKAPKKPVWVIDYPSKGFRVPAFDMGVSTISCGYNEDGSIKVLRNIYVPTSPNPTSGFVINAEPEFVVDADVTVDSHMEYILSCGISQPDEPAYVSKKELPEATGEIVTSDDVIVDRTKPVPKETKKKQPKK
ncbi:TMhelix containing protein [Vibrio phage 2.275.O._10N.286.54.E11]|nr:TMhelix containing protein [Vibrio phage 2.275.O._10N.286.54.E11]